MTRTGDVFADTVFWIALVVRADQYHWRAQRWLQQVDGTIVTTDAVLVETLNALARPDWRSHGVALVDELRQRLDVRIVASSERWDDAMDLYRSRGDKSWGMTDCLSFIAMTDAGLTNALTADEHFRQAGFRSLLMESPSED